MLFDSVLLGANIAWNFDNTLQDQFNIYNGIGSNGPTFRAPGYNGDGACLYLNSSFNQSVSIISPFLSMSNISFSVEVWMYPNTLNNATTNSDNAIFGQFESITTDHALHLSIRNQLIYFGFFTNDVVGTQVSHRKCIINRILNDYHV
jgi:hypothetical protein